MFQPHNAFTFRFSGRTPGLITPVKVTLPTATVGELSSQPSKEYNGLWDTGATNTVITKKVADELGLKSIGKVDVNHADGKSVRDKYLVNIVLPNNLAILSVPVVEGTLTGFDMLVGMDIITLGDFAITNKDNKTVMTFRVPAFKSIDFVPESNKHNFMMTNASKRDREAYLKQNQ